MSEQPAPTPNDQVHVADEAIKYVQRRKALGIERYKTPLQPHNGARQSLNETGNCPVHLRIPIISVHNRSSVR